MVADIRGHEVPPATGVPPARAALLNLSLSVRDTVYVANTTARAQLVSDLTSAGVAPSATNPLFVYRGDTDVMEVTENGTTFRRISAPQTDHDVQLGALWTETLKIRQEVTATGWRMTMRGVLSRASGAFSLGNTWVGIGSTALPAEMVSNVGQTDIIITAQSWPDGSTMGDPITVLLETTTGAFSIRSPSSTQAWGVGGFMRVEGAVWYRDL